MKKKTKTKNTTASLQHCDSSASGGALSCVLDKGHTGPHSTSRDVRKSKQHATWVVGAGGRLAVTTYSRGKKMSEWAEAAKQTAETPAPIDDEDPRPAWLREKTAARDVTAEPKTAATKKSEPCPAKRLGACVLNAGHGGDHLTRKKNAHGLEMRTWNDEHERDPMDNTASTNEWQACPSKTANKGHRCERPLEHDTSHAAISLSSSGSYNFVNWENSAKGTPVHTFLVPDPAAALLNAKPKPLTLDDEPADDEADEAAIAAMDAEDKGTRLADVCTKCGREIGEHDGKKCPPVAHDWEKSNLVTVAKGRSMYDTYRCKGLDAKQPKYCKAQVEPKCGAPNAGEFGWKCTRAKGHDGDHADSTPTRTRQWPKLAPAGSIGRTPSEPCVEVDIDEAFTSDNAHRWWWGYRGELGHVHAKKFTGDMAPILEGRAHPIIGPSVVGPFILAETDHEEQAEVHIRSVHAELGEAAISSLVDDEDDASATATSSRTTSHSPTGETITCRGKVYPVHPAARLFETSAEQFQQVVDSIRTQGQIHDVERLNDPENDNPVIDGCSRLRACEVLGIDPRVKFINVDNPIKYVIAVNLARRHMDESRRAMAAAELATMEHGANQHSRTGKSAAPQVTQAEAAQLLNVSERLVRDATRVKREGVPEVATAIREGKLKVSAGAELSKLSPKQQREILDKTTKGKGEVKSGKIRALVKQEEKREVVRKINTGRVMPMPLGPFGVILADYPWKYDNSDQHDGSRGHMGYPPMEFDDILAHAREVAKRAAKDCVIALWTTNLYIPRMQAVVDAFGAAHHSVFTWPKPRAGVGTWGRGQTEHLIIASIGAPVTTLNEVSTLLPPWHPAHPGEHSSKPAEVRDMLAKHCGGPFLELFAREEREGWTPWGAEVDKFSSEAA